MKLFDLIKQRKYKEVISYIKKNPDIDLNIQDEFNNYFIEYVLDSNNMELIKFFLSKNIYLDII